MYTKDAIYTHNTHTHLHTHTHTHNKNDTFLHFETSGIMSQKEIKNNLILPEVHFPLGRQEVSRQQFCA